MKLSIHTKIITELNSLLKEEYTVPLRFAFGKLWRTGFSPFLNHWDYNCLRDKLAGKYPTSQFRTGQRKHQKICNAGYVVDRHLLLCTVKEDYSGEDMSVTVFRLPEYNVVLIRRKCAYQVEIEFTNKPLNIKDLFEPVKFIYGLIDNITVPVSDDMSQKITLEYNNLLDREQKTPWMIPQGMHFLCEDLLGLLTDYVVTPMYRGKKYMLYLCEFGTFLISKKEILHVEKSVPRSLYQTIIVGDWHEKSFVGYDIAFISGRDVRKKSYLQRAKSLRVVSIRFPFCKMVRFYRNRLHEHVSELLNDYRGVIFMPVKANFTNNRIFIYQLVENVGVRFKLDYSEECGYSTYTLKTGMYQDLFLGTSEFPFSSHIPLTQEDKEFIGPLQNTVFEFRWEGNNWLPYVQVHEHEVSSSKFACQAWEYINKPLPYTELLDNIRTFKKEVYYTKEKLAMAKSLGKLKMLPVNRTVVFYSPIEGEDVLVRSGTIAEGSCFFHALLYAYSQEYIGMDKAHRMEFVRNLRASMAGKVDKESWEQMGGGLIARVPFQENVNDILVNFYRFLNNDDRARGRNTRKVIKKLVGDDPGKLDLYKLISELIPIEEGFEQIILPKAYEKSENESLEDCRAIIIDETIEYVNAKDELHNLAKEKSEYIRNAIRNFLDEVIKVAENSAFKEYVKGLENVAEDVDSYTIGLISQRFKRDIYFLDGKNRMPYNNSSTTENLKGRKSMIVLWIGGNHYEIAGRLLPGNRVQRQFDHDDPLIQKLYTFLVKPEQVSEKYPELVPYLPREYRGHTSPSPQRFSDSDSSADGRNKMPSSSSSDDDDDYYRQHSSDDE